jgi:hypothetical protein
VKKRLRKLSQWKHTFWWLILGISASIGINGLLEWEFEDEILRTIAENITSRTKGKSETALVDTTIQVCFYLQERRSEICGKHTYTASNAHRFRSSLQSFYIGTGACGYYSLFEARVFQQLGYTPKIVQQRVNGRWGAHITLAIPLKQNPRIILVDPLSHHTFKDSSGELSSIEQVRSNWHQYYAQHVPLHYDPAYNYQQGIRHTNWDKYGFISRSVYRVLTFTIGQEKTDTLCFRMWIIDPYRMQAFFAFLVSAFCVLMIVLGYRHHNPLVN